MQEVFCMKNVFKPFGIIALVALIGFTFAACGDSNTGDSSGPSGKAAGAAAGIPVVVAETLTARSVTVSAVITGANPGKQTVEYAKAEGVNSAPATGWQEGGAFSGLKPETKYYFFARSKDNATHNAGAASAGLEVTTLESNLEEGATVSAVEQVEVTATTVTVSATITGDNPGDQEVEYAKADTNSAPANGWQEDGTFDHLTPQTGYWFFARAKETEDYDAGTPSAGLELTTGAVATGAEVDAAPVADTTYTSASKITVNEVTITTNPGNQDVEYAIATADTSVPTSGWQSGRSFYNLLADTDYYVFARAAEKGDYVAGTAQASAAITTESVPSFSTLAAFGTWLDTFADEEGDYNSMAAPVTVKWTGSVMNDVSVARQTPGDDGPTESVEGMTLAKNVFINLDLSDMGSPGTPVAPPAQYQFNTFSTLIELILPKNITYTKNSTETIFANIKNLKTVVISEHGTPGTITPETTTRFIGPYFFKYGHSTGISVSIPAYTAVWGNAFRDDYWGVSGVTRVTFEGPVTYIGANSFYGPATGTGNLASLYREHVGMTAGTSVELNATEIATLEGGSIDHLFPVTFVAKNLGPTTRADATAANWLGKQGVVAESIWEIEE
jgi:hypothetical protein